MNFFLYGVFPYMAFTIALFVGLYRYFSHRFTYSSLSSQLIENRVLFWSSIGWHYAIIIILLTHLFVACAPNYWASLLVEPLQRFSLEYIGLCLGFLALFGILLSTIRRIAYRDLQRVTTVMDWVLLAALIAQVGTGLYNSLFNRWGSLWYTDTAVPWFWSIFVLSPKYDAILPLPSATQFHMINGYAIIGLFPLTRLVHIFTVPITYLWRPYQVVIWNSRKLGKGGVPAARTTASFEKGRGGLPSRPE